jgi:hypothetical protein
MRNTYLVSGLLTYFLFAEEQLCSVGGPMSADDAQAGGVQVIRCSLTGWMYFATAALWVRI